RLPRISRTRDAFFDIASPTELHRRGGLCEASDRESAQQLAIALYHNHGFRIDDGCRAHECMFSIIERPFHASFQGTKQRLTGEWGFDYRQTEMQQSFYKFIEPHFASHSFLHRQVKSSSCTWQ